jgi:hypothetical protein
MPRRIIACLALALGFLTAAPILAGAASPAARAERDREFGFQLLLMRGHLAVGRALLDAGRRDMAAEHFAHPRAELYDDVAPELKRRGIKPFDARLQALADAAASDKASVEDVRARLARVLASVGGAWNTIPAERRHDPGFVAALVGDALYAAAGEYGTAVEDGRFAEVSEYQDSHGFLVAARELWRGAAETVRRSRPASYERVAAALATFERALPTPLPPPAPVVEPEALKRAAGDLVAALQEKKT